MALMDGKVSVTEMKPAEGKSDVVGMVATDKDTTFKVRKKEAAKKYAEKKKAQAAARIEAAKKLVEELKKIGAYDKLNKEYQDILMSWTVPQARIVATGSNLFVTIFGEHPKVGDRVTLKEVFNKTLKGEATINTFIKSLLKKGIVVKYTVNEKNLIESTYEIVSLPSIQ